MKRQSNSHSIMLDNLFRISAVAILASLFSTQIAFAYELEWNEVEIMIELKPDENEAKAEFTVTNKGQETVQIDRIESSCSCTGSILDKKIIEPGESSTIVGTFTKDNREGLNQNLLKVFIKGQDKPVEILNMVVKIPKLINTNPVVVHWSRGSPRTERLIEIKLDRRYVNKISSIEYDPNLLTVIEKDDYNASVDGALTILPKSFDEKLHQMVLIKATGENGLTGEVKIPVFVRP